MSLGRLIQPGYTAEAHLEAVPPIDGDGVLGSVLALGVRLFVDVLAQTARMLLSLSG